MISSNKIDLHNGDCLEVMDKLIENNVKVDAIICDPPYGTTACKWDSVIPFDNYITLTKTNHFPKTKKQKTMYKEEFLLHCFKQGMTFKNAEICFEKNAKEGMWQKLNKLIKPNGVIVLFGSEPFSSALRMSNIKNYKYDWVWVKTKAGNFIQAKNMPLKKNELISIFSNGVVIHKGQSKKRMIYNPQGTIEVDKDWSRPKVYDSEHNFKRPSHKTERKITQEGFPSTILEFNSVHNPPHPTQKPVALMEYLIKTYTNENETVLDFTMGSGTAGVACKNLNRNFIGIELDKDYFKIAKDRIEEIIKIDGETKHDFF